MIATHSLKVGLLAILLRFIKRIFHHSGEIIYDLQTLETPEEVDTSEPTVKLLRNTLKHLYKGNKWRQYTPSRYVKWLAQNTGPNRKQRREDARTYRDNLRCIAHRKIRLEEQRVSKQLRMAQGYSMF
jgi:hypothetical protein